MAGNTEPLSPRAKLAVTAGKAAAAVSRAAGRGSGSVIGGRVALKLDPDLLGRLAQHLDVILVSATNGKTTTTRLIAEALRASGPVVSNALGANMPAGITSALAGGSDAKLRRDRGRREVPRRRGPGRDAQGDRAAQPLPRPAGPRGGDPDARREVARGSVRVEGRGRRQRRRPADRVGGVLLAQRGVGGRRPGVEGRRLVVPVLRRCDAAPGRRLVLRRVRFPASRPQLGLPATTCSTRTVGVADPPPAARPREQGDATSSAAVAAVFGVPPQVALERMYQVQAVAGRYDVVTFLGRELRLLLAKNPAGWLETFSLIDPPPTPVILSVNARGADGTDTSWLWDVDYTQLAGHPIFVLGDRKLDLAVRLEVAGPRLPGLRSLDEAVQMSPPGRIEVIANYTAFQDLRRRVGN